MIGVTSIKRICKNKLCLRYLVCKWKYFVIVFVSFR